MIGRAGEGRLPYRAAWVTLLGGLLAMLLPAAALAHATLVATDPLDGSVLQRAPARLLLDFNEPVAPFVVRLLGPDGRDVALGEVTQENTRVRAELPGALATGTHVLSWRVVSADGHPVGGTVVFSIGAPSPGGSTSSPIEPTLKAAIYSLRLLLFGSLFIGVGGALLRSWAGPPLPISAERIVVVGLWTGAVSSLLSIGLQGSDLLGLGVGGILDPAGWKAATRTSYAAMAGLSCLAILLALAGISARSARNGRVATVAAVVAAAGAFATSGHASTAPPQVVTRVAVFLHILGLSFWIGALVPLAMLLWQRGTGAKAVLLGFSRAAPYAVFAVITSGFVLATIQISTVAALWTSDYGKLLLCKFVLLFALTGLVAWNRFWLTPRAAAGDQDACGLMARSIAGEIVLVFAILAVVAGWRFTPPPRALAAAVASPVHVHVHTDRAMADVELAPGRVGPMRLSVHPMTADFAPLDAKELTVILSNSEAGIEPIRRAATEERPGVWRSELQIPVPGRWSLRLEILINDFEKVTLEADAAIRPH